MNSAGFGRKTPTWRQALARGIVRPTGRRAGGERHLSEHHAARNERAYRIAQALEQLPADQRSRGCPPPSERRAAGRGCGRVGSRSKEAVAGLLHRGLVHCANYSGTMHLTEE